MAKRKGSPKTGGRIKNTPNKRTQRRAALRRAQYEEAKRKRILAGPGEVFVAENCNPLREAIRTGKNKDLEPSDRASLGRFWLEMCELMPGYQKNPETIQLDAKDKTFLPEWFQDRLRLEAAEPEQPVSV